MSIKREYVDYLEDILDAVVKIDKFIADQSFDDFAQDDKSQFAVIRAFEIIGEASKKIPVHIKERYCNVPWRIMAGMRDKLVHEYFGVDIQVVWKTATEDIKDLEPIIQEIIKDFQ